jgi:hypothetical protein
MKKSLLRKVLALIDTPEKWCKGNAKVLSTNSVSYCVLSACVEAGVDRNSLNSLISVLNGRIVDFNDHPDTTHEDIMALFDLAIAFDEVGGL